MRTWFVTPALVCICQSGRSRCREAEIVTGEWCADTWSGGERSAAAQCIHTVTTVMCQIGESSGGGAATDI